MASKTISLDEGAYTKLKAEKRPGESFSDVVHRLLEPDQPSLREFVDLLDEGTAEDLAAVIERMDAEDIEAQRDPEGFL